MIWKSVKAARQAWCPDASEKSMYAAIATGKLKAARYGVAERNLLLCEQFVDAWLLASAGVQRNAPASKAEALLQSTGDGLNGPYTTRA